jgi:spore coat protein U-like protein
MHEIRIRRGTAIFLGGLLGLAAATSIATVANANNPTASLNITATVPEVCTVEVIADIDFPNYVGIEITAPGIIKINCSPENVNVKINNGQSTNGGRVLKNGTAELPYTLWRKEPLAEWPTNGNPLQIPSNANVEIEGKIGGGLDVPSGSYSDQVIVELVL